MKKILQELVEMSKEDKKEVGIAYNKNNEVSIYDIYSYEYIEDHFKIGTLNLEVYNTYKDIEKEIEWMIENV